MPGRRTNDWGIDGFEVLTVGKISLYKYLCSQ